MNTWVATLATVVQVAFEQVAFEFRLECWQVARLGGRLFWVASMASVKAPR